MRGVILSDIHLGRFKYGKIDLKTGLDYRTLDILNNIQQAFDFAVAKQVNWVSITGDFYHTKKPPQIFRRLLSEKIEWLLSKKILLFLMLGNHDQGKSQGHDMVELTELSDHIKNLYVIEHPETFDIGEGTLCFLPHVNKFDYNIADTDYYARRLLHIKELEGDATHSDKKYKLFFGHFGTDCSTVGKSFDLGAANADKVVPLTTFDGKVWTKVYLGDIHKQQEMNDVCRHIGSIARVDFGEEGELKGFYYFEDGTDKFIMVKDREFRTLTVDLTQGTDVRESMKQFCYDVQDFDLSQAIVRLKVTIKSTDKGAISFKGIEDYLKEETWNYIGKSINEIHVDNDQKINLTDNQELNYVGMFERYVAGLNLDEKIVDDVLKTGREMLGELIKEEM